MVGPVKLVRCVFSTNFLQIDVDPRLKTLYAERGKRVPFGDFRRTWWRDHCQQMGGAEFCPYPEQDCALAFLRAATIVVDADRPGAMFRAVAKRHAMLRLEGKPLARETKSRSTPAGSDSRPVGNTSRQGGGPRPDEGVPGPTTGYAMGVDSTRSSVHGSRTRPERIGSVLRRLDFGPREVRADDRQEGTGQREASRDPVSPSSPRPRGRV